MCKLWELGYVNGDIYDQEVGTTVTCLRPNVLPQEYGLPSVGQLQEFIPRPVNKKVRTSVAVCCRWWVNESRQIRGQYRVLPSLFCLIWLLHNTCYKLLITLNERMEAHIMCSDVCHTPTACIFPAIDIICRPLTFVIRVNIFWSSLYNQWESSTTHYKGILVQFSLHNIKFFCRNHWIFPTI